MTARRALLLLGVAVLAGCGSDDADAARRDMLMPACSWPDGTDTYDPATQAGCRARSMFQVCLVPEGSIYHPSSGTITTPSGEVVEGTCMNQCTPTEFSLVCSSGTTFGPIPEPDPALRCRHIPVPTPSGVAPLCCPCSP